MRRLVYTNPDGAEIAFTETRYGLTKLEGLGAPDVTIQEQKSPFQDGSVSIDQLLMPRNVVIEGVVAVGNNNALRYQYRKDLCAVVNPKLGPGRLTYTNDHGTWTLTGIPKGPVFPNKNANDGNQRFQITFYCFDPYMYDVSETELEMQNVVPLTTFPLTFLAGGNILSEYVGGAKSAFNSGDYATPITLRIYGPCTNPKLTKVNTGEFLKITKVMASGDLLEISTRAGYKTVYYTPSGGSRANAINLLDFDSTFFQLDPGENSLELTDDTASGSKLCFVSWYNRYVGV